MTLDQVPVGQKARIVEVNGQTHVGQRLLEMGLVEQEDVEVVAHAPLGDPIEILVRNYRLSLRRIEAANVQVLPLD